MPKTPRREIAEEVAAAVASKDNERIGAVLYKLAALVQNSAKFRKDEDMTQEMVMKAYMVIHKAETRRPAIQYSYLWTTMRNHGLNTLEKNGRWDRVSLLADEVRDEIMASEKEAPECQ